MGFKDNQVSLACLNKNNITNESSWEMEKILFMVNILLVIVFKEMTLLIFMNARRLWFMVKQ